MKNLITLLFSSFILTIPSLPQTPPPVTERNFQLALPSHNGQLQWTASGYRIVEFSAKSGGQEIGIRGKDTPGRLTFLGFLFLVNERAPLTSAKCRDGAVGAMKKENPAIKILTTYQISDSSSLPVEVVSYSTSAGQGKMGYSMRAFTASGDLCGDLEFYSEAPISPDDGELRKIFASMRLDLSYVPQFRDVLLYAQILYQHRAFKPAAPIFEEALLKLDGGPEQQSLRRAVTDQAGMSYGMSGDIPKARAIFAAAIAKDPDYPLYYYNLACADAEEGKLADARKHLQQAFARKANVIPGETMPDPTKDDSFLPYRSKKDFWTFIESLH